MNWNSFYHKHIKTRWFLWISLTIISALLFTYVVFPNFEPSYWYITFSLVMMFTAMLLFVSILIGLKKRKVKIFGGKKKVKVFEFGFFLCLFIATISASDIIAISHLPNLSIEAKLNLIRQQFWFIGLYGVAIAFGIYHYILRMDD